MNIVGDRILTIAFLFELLTGFFWEPRRREGREGRGNRELFVNHLGLLYIGLICYPSLNSRIVTNYRVVVCDVKAIAHSP
ncbi:hypothetical protein [Iningainema tapete]|uniref:Uncharacterized protein n=1 Tax=Iningainema tapete BLCC-T55 TaxID=2748662 RepID=A0A8J6XVM8_9CYAN|nr:hypothetical protein [Iningainema tapete]MBD2778671.1 hypothetical protein [Iningainema tapete BLCC-T55]